LTIFCQPSERGGNFVKFGIDVSRDFCARNSLKMVVRSHQYWMEFPGYKVHHEGRVVTVSAARMCPCGCTCSTIDALDFTFTLQVFSAANYCGSARNGAAVLLMAETSCRDIVATFKTIPAFAS
jgi:hypothetical protein